MRRFWARMVSLFTRRKADEEMTREIESHLALLRDEFEARGLAPDDAKFAALRAYGSVQQTRELHRETRSFAWIEFLFKDVRYGCRNLLRTPLFSAVAILALALGIGANTAIFSVVDAVLLRPLAYKDPDRLVTLLHNGAEPVATANYLDWRAQSLSFEAMGAADFWSPNITSSGQSDHSTAEHLYGLKVTRNLLPLLGVQPLMGRFFLEAEDEQNANREIILSFTLWQRRFNGDREVLGKLVTLDGETYSVVGVMPPAFKFAPFWATHAELWTPVSFAETMGQRGGNHLRVFARLKPNVTLAQARADIAIVTGRLEKLYPATNRGVMVRPLKENVVGNIETPLFLMLGAVSFVLLIACVNVAHLLLARTSDRQKEIAVRVALGASKTRLFAQFLTENLLLAATGALAGLLLAWAGTKALVVLSPSYLPRVEMVKINGNVLIFLLGVAVLTALAFGLVPAMHAAAGHVGTALKEGGRADTGGIRQNRLRGFLMASEFALAFMLLIGAGLMVRSFYALQSVDTGFDPHNVLTMVVSVAGTRETDAGQRRIFYQELLQKVGTLPGVNSAGAINHVPLVGDMWDRNFLIEGRARAQPGEAPDAVYRIAMPGYFQAMRLPIKRGRAITGDDNANTMPVVIVNECAARRFWPNQDPIGKRILLPEREGAQGKWLTIIGVAGNARLDDMVSPPYPEIYLAALQTPEFMGEISNSISPHMSYLTLVVRAAKGRLADVTHEVRRTIQSFDRNIPVSQVVTMDEAVSTATAASRFEMLLLTLFAAVALTLAAVGIYGVMSYTVSRRTREIGIRMSLGASRRDIFHVVISHAIKLALAGTLAGIGGAALLSRFMASMIFEVQPTDPLTFAGATMTLGVAALLATAIPARRAVQIEPSEALRAE